MRTFLARLRWVHVALALLGLQGQGLLAQPLALNVALREQVLMVKKGDGLFSTEFETTFFRPPGDGPFPVVIINHGKAKGDTRFDPRARYEAAAREFVRRNYMVVLPMRQGFSKSSGSYIGGGCNVESNGRVQAQDVQAVIGFLNSVPDADISRIVVIGQSHGGLTTMALGTSNPAGVRGLINFAGGLRNDQCVSWEAQLAKAFGAYGREARIPSLWLYGENDSFWPAPLYQDMHRQFVEAGGQARLVEVGKFGADSHGLFASGGGVPVWLPHVERFLRELSLPTAVVHSIPSRGHTQPVPPASNFAALTDESALPAVKDASSKGYVKFLAGEWPRAFAISPSGSWAFYYGRSDAMTAAVERCNQFAKDNSCRLYAVDDVVVWTKQ